MKENKHIIFDLDGTIIDSKDEIILTYQKVIESVPIDYELNLDTLDFGANLNQNLNFIYKTNSSKIELAKMKFIELYDNSNFENTLVYDYVYETLDEIMKKNISLYIATNKRYIPTQKILKSKNLSHYFTEVIGNEYEPNISITKKKMLEYLMIKHRFKKGVMIGDTIGDIIAGKENGLDTIAVSYGYQSLSELEKVKPDYIVKSFEDLLNFFHCKEST